jgi:F-type H+-transporting ATPase subunit b
MNYVTIVQFFVYNKYDITYYLHQKSYYFLFSLHLTEQYKLDAARNLETSEDVLKQARIDAREIMKHSDNEAKLIINEAKEKATQILKDANEEAFHARTRSYRKADHIKGGVIT